MKNDIKDVDGTISDVAADLTKLLAMLATVFIVTAIIYEYMYCWTIGFEFLSIYSGTDFAKTAVSWVPATLILGSIGILINFKDLDARMSAVKIHGISALAAWDKPDRYFNYAMYTITFITIICLPFTKWSGINVLQLPAYFIMSFIIGRQIASGRLSVTSRPAEGIMFYIFIGWINVSAVFGGLTSGIRDVSRPSPVFEICLDNEEIDAVILRSIDKGIIFRKVDGRNVNFIPWDKVKRLSSAEVKISEDTIFDYVKGIFSKLTGSI